MPISDETRKKLRAAKAKGDSFERRIKEYLESVGYTVDKARAQLKRYAKFGKMHFFSTPNDFWGFADLIGVHKNRDYTLIVQCTTDKSKLSSKKTKAMTVPWNPRAQRVLIMMPQPGIRGGIVAYRLEGWSQLNDEEREGVWREQFFRMSKGELPLGELL